MSRANRIAAEFLREQLQMDGIQSSELSRVFRDEPPALDTFLYDQAYLNHLRPTVPGPDLNGYAFKLSPIQRNFLRSMEQVFFPDLYIAMVEEFGEAWAPVPMKNMFVANWGKGSKHPDEPVYNAKNGQWVKLRDFKSGPVASAYEDKGKVFKAEATDSFLEGYGSMYEVTTQSGRKTKVWEGHRFLAWNQEKYPSGKQVKCFNRAKGAKWKRLLDLKVGDHIAVSSTLPEPSEVLDIPDWQVELIGLMLGDGCITASARGDFNHSLTIGYQSPIQLEHCLDLIRRETDLQCRVHDDGRKLTLYPSNETGSRGKINVIKELMDTYGLQGHSAKSKHIPKELFSLNTRQIALLLSRLIDTDGWVCVSNTAEVGYGTISEQLAEDVMNLFLRLGILAERKTKNTTYNGEPYVSYQVRVRRNELIQRLLPQLTLLDKESKKLEALDWVKSNTKGRKQHLHGDMEWDRIKTIKYIGEGEYWTMTVDGPCSYLSSGGILDHNSGKDTVVRLGITRIVSLLNHLNSPQGYFNMPSTDAIHCLNVATTAPQARRAFFDPMKQLFKSNKYLSDMFYGDDPADGANQIRLKNDIYIISGNSQAESQEGLNLMAGVADEISAFKVAEEYRDRGGVRENRGAEGIVNFLRSSASSRFPDTYKVVQISFPRFANDAIEKAVKAGLKSNKDNGEKSIWYVSGPHATWEVKPTVNKENFAEHYIEDADKAAAMYECKPPKSSNAFIRDEGAIDAVFSTVSQEPVTVEYYWGTNTPIGELDSMGPDGLQATDGWQVNFMFAEDFKPVDGAVYCLHGDLAIKGDRAGIAMSHVKEYQPFGNEDDERPIIKNDFVFSFSSDFSDRERPREVQIRWYRQLLWELLDRGFDVGTVTFDQFQSFDMIQTLQNYGIDSGLLSLDRNDKVYQTVKDVILDRRLIGYRSDTLNEFEDPLVASELKRLRRVGRKIDHLPGQSKDEADAFAGSVFNAIKAGGEEYTNDEHISDEEESNINEMIMYSGAFSANPKPFEIGVDSDFNPFTHHSPGMDSLFSPVDRY